ncbi:MAG: hypothetical protein QM749_19760 [Aquabacterium sp.]
MPRLSINNPGFAKGASSGIVKGINTWLNGDKTYKDAYDKEDLNQSRIAQLAGLQAQQAAQARHFDAQADNERAKTDVLQSRPGIYEEQAAINSGTDIPTIRAFRSQVAGGSPQVPMGPPTESGQMDVGSFQAGPETRSKIGLALQQFAPLLTNTGDLKPDDMAQAFKLFSDQGIRGDLLAGRRTPDDVATTMAAMQGKSTQIAGPKAPTGYQWAGDTPGQTLEPIPGGPKDPKAVQPKPGRGSPPPIDRDQVAILSQELFNTREKMKSAQGADLMRLQGDEAAVVAELKRAGVKDLGQLKPQTPGKSAGNASEDERKAAGWVAQAENAWKNMQAVAFDKKGGLITDAKPGFWESVPGLPEGARNFSRSEGRQRFVQAASSMSEALLRAATGAGVNRDEAIQKIREITPQVFDGEAVIKQKMDSIPVYLKSLRQRAGRALPQDASAGASVPAAGFVQDGYQFLGGDPSKQDNWQRVQ